MTDKRRTNEEEGQRNDRTTTYEGKTNDEGGMWDGNTKGWVRTEDEVLLRVTMS